MNDVVRLLELSAYAAYHASRPNCVNGIRWLAWFRNPQPGDLVLETSAIHEQQYIGRRLGHLLLVQEEFVPYGEEPGGYWDKFYYLRLLDGLQEKWRNASFIRVVPELQTVFDLEFPKSQGVHQCES